MLAIPLPFVMSLLLVMIAILLLIKSPVEGKMPFIFIILCAVSTMVVGLRWTFDIAILRFLQPIIASLLPVTAWYCFARAHARGQFSLWHLSGPIIITLCSFWFQFWLEAIDVFLAIIYLGYGVLLIRNSFLMPEEVRIGNTNRVVIAERITGIMLLVSACVDVMLSFDFAVYGGEHAHSILSLSYLLLIPAVVGAVIVVGFSTFQTEPLACSQPKPMQAEAIVLPIKKAQLSAQDAQEIVNKIDRLMKEKEVFRDPDLTLSRLSRKITIPARQVSMAVNQVCGMNISKVLNEYRITYAQQLLVCSEDSITDIYLNSGFQTKSNFNREFSRITGKTPSQYRQDKAPLL